ncbi:MAG: patatin-like phospholipase family protein [Candidatus Woesearchaeota archaeon]
MKRKLGLALGSGGAKGFAHVGVIQVLLENNIAIDCIAGSSAGAIVGAYYALHLEVDGLAEWANKFKKKDLVRLLDFHKPDSSMIKGKKIRDFLNQNFFLDMSISDARIPLGIVATVLEDGKPFVFKSGKIVDAVMASATVPGIIPPTIYNGKHLVDGAFADAVPIKVCKQLGAEVVLGIDLYSITRVNDEYNSMIRIMERSWKLLMAKLSDQLECQNDPGVLVLRPKVKWDELFAFENSEKHLRLGRRVAKAALPRIKKLLRRV